MNDKYYKVDCKCGAEIQENEIRLFRDFSRLNTLHIVTHCKKCDTLYSVDFNSLPEEHPYIKPNSKRIKRALQEGIIKIIDKETEDKMKEVTNLCNGVDEALSSKEIKKGADVSVENKIKEELLEKIDEYNTKLFKESWIGYSYIIQDYLDGFNNQEENTNLCFSEIVSIYNKQIRVMRNEIIKLKEEKETFEGGFYGMLKAMKTLQTEINNLKSTDDFE
jgi:hypothetical protein